MSILSENNQNPLQDHLSTVDVLQSLETDVKRDQQKPETIANEHELLDDGVEKTSSDDDKIPVMVTYLGIMMFLMNCAFVMVYSFSALYLRSLGLPFAGIGFIEGVGDAISFVMKFFSGAISDALGRRKPVMYIGYALSVFSRPIMAAAGSFVPFLCGKYMERIGNGIQGSPRDAIVADVTPQKRIGAAYGLKRSIAQFGSIIGAILGFTAMTLTDGNMKAVFWYACIPSTFAFLLLIFCVKEPKRIKHSAVSAEVPLPAIKRRHKIAWNNIRLLGSKFWMLMFVNTIFMLARVGEQFIILHANHNYAMPEKYAPIVMIIYNLGWCLTSYPVGLLADRMNRYWLLSLGVIFLVMASIMLASAGNWFLLGLGILFWGFQYGITMNIFVSLIAETVPENLRGTGFGFYYIITAATTVAAETLAGKLADLYGHSVSFISSSIIGLLSLVVLILIMAYRSSPRKMTQGL